ncbi:GmrSD restriction endonuclease domain-containing protein [Hoyosella altamirensis]|uniref:GmrSD restriction endonucleases N-terminal domain-containing protein n=1 Tax=Hoyosella altamirensis TaxID=616997 RepID=A0A839RUU5_9ACTN|nr:DUF262 domain-containing protein [Hoyosella altamirensis]MBB3040119.1 hypothetical protein [Hoyosella altamirensis]
MGYSEPATIVSQLRKIQDRKLVLPAIQRDFVWSKRQIENLFDSIMRGYPIGAFLSWTIEPSTARSFKFYEFMLKYHERDNPHCSVLDLPTNTPVRAVLDGQQRLTALNIGLRGSYAEKRPGAWRTNPNAYPATRLYLNLRNKAPENDEGREFDFRFLSEAQLANFAGNQEYLWFPVAEVYDRRMGEVYATARELDMADSATWALELFERVNSDRLLYFYDEESQDIDRVLDIFIRVNSGGTTLSKSDLLMSIATAQWAERDAREEINDLVRSVNAAGEGFSFSRDTVLKAGLVLTDISDVGFKVGNFNSTNMAKLEKQWDEISSSLTTAAGLLGDFGLSSATLTAHSVLIPIAYYLHHRGLDDSYRTAVKYENDRRLVKSWVLRSLIKSGIWGSGLDTLLRDLRVVIQRATPTAFPAESLEEAMAARGKSLRLTDPEIDSILTSTYGRPETFAILAILFPHVNTRNIHHVDHIFPKSQLTRPKLKKAGLDPDTIESIVMHRDQLPNLMLLEMGANTSKAATDPASWMNGQPDEAARATVASLNALPQSLPSNPSGFEAFFTERATILEGRIRSLLG